MVAAQVIAAVLLMQAAPRDARPPDARATLHGRVTERGSERPLPRIVVSLEASSDLRIEVLTDAQGRYVFGDVPPGRYVLAAAPERYRSTYLAQRFGESEPAFYVSGRPAANIELKPGEARPGVDLSLMRSLAIEGRVVDHLDQPIASLEVSVVRADGRFVPVRDSVTNDVGAYRLYGLAPGRYRVCASVEGPEAGVAADGTRFVRTCHMASTSEAAASDVVLSASDATGIDIRMQRVGSLTISGSVTDASGTAVHNGNVIAAPLDEHATSLSASTDGGQFTIKGLVPGRYLLTGSFPVVVPGDPNPPSRAREVGYAVVDVQSADVAGIAIALARPKTLPGRVIFEGTGAPPRQQRRMVVYTRPAEEQWHRSEGRPAQAPVGDDLRFELKEIYSLPRLMTLSDVPSGWALKTVRLDGREITHVPADLTAGARLEIVLTNEVVTPSVRVTVPAGAATLFHVLLFPVNPERWRGGLQFIPGDRAKDNVLALGSQIQGEYLVAALRVDDAITVMRDPERLAQVASVAVRVTFRREDDRTIELPLVSLPSQR